WECRWNLRRAWRGTTHGVLRRYRRPDCKPHTFADVSLRGAATGDPAFRWGARALGFERLPRAVRKPSCYRGWRAVSRFPTRSRRRQHRCPEVEGALRARLLRISLDRDADIVMARQRARHIADLLGLSGQDQIRLATAVSEIARNAIEHGGGGTAEFALVGRSPPQLLEVTISDNGLGIPVQQPGNR